MPLAALGIGAGASLLSGLFGASAAEKAAQQQAEAAQKGINIAQGNTREAMNAQLGQNQSLQQTFNPYLQAGATATGTLSDMLKPGGSLLQGWNQNFQAPTAAEAAQTPGYQFQLQQGMDALQNSAAARGTLLNTGTMKNLMGYGQGLADSTYQQTYNNAFQNYLQNYGQFQQNQQNQYSRLSGLGGLGAQMAGEYGQLGQAGANNTASIYGNNTNAMSQLLGSQGAAQASGTIGAANAWGGALNNIGGMASQYGMLKSFLPQLQQGWGTTGG